jgi:DnaJ family protein A protein 2
MFQSLFSKDPKENRPIDNERLYKCLDVNRDCDAVQIKKAYHRLARIHHPDKGGNPDKFKEIHHAYEILSDPHQRSIYDQFGESALGSGLGGKEETSSFETSFANMFNPLPRKAKPTVFYLRVTLDELYTGTTKTLHLKSKGTCTLCSGIGGSEHYSCKTCSGSGKRLTGRPIGPGLIQQIYISCTDCGGSGILVPPHATCTMCKGEKKVEITTPLTVIIEKGMFGGTKIILPGEHEVTVILQEIDHAQFTRHGPHLFMRWSITLRQALTGLHTKILHLGNREICVRSPPNQILGSGTYQKIEGEGMNLSGDLFLEIHIVFPLEISPHFQTLLKEHLVEDEDYVHIENSDSDYQCSSVDSDQIKCIFALNNTNPATHDEDEEQRNSSNPGCRTQ